MSLPTTTKTAHQFTPEGSKHVYQWNSPSVMQKANYNRLQRSLGIRYVTDSELRQALREAVTAIFPKSEQGRYQDLLDQCHDESIDENSSQQLQDLEQAVMAEHPAYALMVADRQYILEVSPYLAIRCLLNRMDDTVIRRGNEILDESILEKIPEEDLLLLGYQLISSMHVSKQDAKN